MDLNLKKLSNEKLITDLKGLVASERELLIQLLHYLREVEQRRLYAQRGYDSLFSFMREELGYSEAAADRRIKAMRLMKDLPEVEEKLATGAISLTVASTVQRFIKKEEKKRKEENQNPLPKSEKLELIKTLEGSSQRDCEKKLAQISPETALPKDKTRLITEEKVHISFTAGQSLLKKIERLKILTAHQNPNGNYELLFEKALDLALVKLDPERKAQKPPRQKFKPRTKVISITPAPEWKQTRHIPHTLRQQVWLRDQGRCQYQDKQTGKTCHSQYLLEIDHALPYSLGGTHTLDNLRLHCRTHNQYRAGLIFHRGKTKHNKLEVTGNELNNG